MVFPSIAIDIYIQGQTPLWFAANQGHLEVVQALLDHPEVDVNITNEEVSKEENTRQAGYSCACTQIQTIHLLDPLIYHTYV